MPFNSLPLSLDLSKTAEHRVHISRVFMHRALTLKQRGLQNALSLSTVKYGS